MFQKQGFAGANPARATRMVKVSVSDYIKRKAALKAKELGKLNNSITHGQGNIVGFIGELIVKQYLEARANNTFDYDITKNSIKIDVKSKTCTSAPKSSYACSIAAYNTKQKCDYYIFTRVLNDLSCCWILGWYPKEQYLKDAQFCKMGDKDKSSDCGWRYKADCYNIEIEKLFPISIFKREIAKKYFSETRFVKIVGKYLISNPKN